MAGRGLKDAVWRGLGAAARGIGERADAYRPVDGRNPLRLGNRFLRLPAWFTPPRMQSVRSGGYGEALWEGVFDAAYTLPGDYLVGADGGIWFVAAQWPMQPPLCVRAQRRVSLTRVAGPVSAGANLYGGVAPERASEVLRDWPASIAAASRTGERALATAGDMQQGAWLVLLPPHAWLGLMAGDALTDDLGRAGVVARAEYTEMGWRLLVQQSTA